jgi:hypothetical protein
MLVLFERVCCGGVRVSGCRRDRDATLKIGANVLLIYIWRRYFDWPSFEHAKKSKIAAKRVYNFNQSLIIFL